VKETSLSSISLLQLSHHRSGLIDDLDKEEEEEFSRVVSALPLNEQRRAYVCRISSKPLHHLPGERYGPYSNGAYVVLASVVETAVGMTWEDLVTTHVTCPLGMNSFGFGSPTGGPIGHDEDDIPQPLYIDKPFLHPSFSVHSTLEDWLKFASVHMKVLRGEYKDSPLKAKKESLEFLQKGVSFGDVYDGSEPPDGYAMGWKTQWCEDENGQGEREGEKENEKSSHPVCLWHFGTNFRYNAGILLHREKDLIAVTASNSGSMVTRLAMRSALEKLLEMA